MNCPIARRVCRIPGVPCSCDVALVPVWTGAQAVQGGVQVLPPGPPGAQGQPPGD